jgi:hypothetical protein
MNAMPVTEMIVGISGGLFMLTAFIYLLRLMQAWMLHRTLRDAINRDSSIAAGLVERIDRGRPGQSVSDDDRSGLVLLAAGSALIGFSLIVGDPEWARYGIGAALFPLLIGLALVARHIWLRRTLEHDLAGPA